MDRLEELNQEIKALESKLEPLQVERRELWTKREEEIKEKLKSVQMLEDKFTIDELVFSAEARCICGAGLAYPDNSGIQGSWYCADILLGKALPKSNSDSKQHSGAYPFSFYNIKSEGQPSAESKTTRPENE